MMVVAYADIKDHIEDRFHGHSVDTLSGCLPNIGSIEGNESIAIGGLSSMQPLAEKLAKSFMDKNPKVAITVQDGGTSAGIKEASDDIIDIGMASREILPDESSLNSYLIAKDGIAIIVSPKNMVNNLTKDQLKDIFSVKITNWSEVDGTDQEIHVATREIGSGTAATFEYVVMSGEPITKYAILEPSSGALRQVVSDEQAIAFLSFGYLDKDTKSISLDGVSATNTNINNGSYPLVRPFYLVTKGEKTGEVKRFIDFCTGSDGQLVVATEGYLKVN